MKHLSKTHCIKNANFADIGVEIIILFKIVPAMAWAKSVLPHPVGPWSKRVSVSEDFSHSKPIIRYNKSNNVSSIPATFRKFTVESLKVVSSFFLRAVFKGVGELGRLLLFELTVAAKTKILFLKNMVKQNCKENIFENLQNIF